MNIAYLAGFFDGEGCMWLQKREKSRPAFLVAVVNTERGPLREFKRRWGGSIHPLIDHRPRLAPRIVYKWSASGKAARRAVLAMQRYFVVKAQQAKTWLRAWDVISTRPKGDRKEGRERWFRARLSAMKRR
jgi:hypothetical protein